MFNIDHIKLETPCSYQGGKQRIAKQIVDVFFEQNEINKDTLFYDLCCGSGAISIELVNRGIKPKNIIMLDRSPWGLVWKKIGNGEFDINKFKEVVDNVPKDVSQIQSYIKELSKQPSHIDTEYIFLLLQASSFGSKSIWITENTWQNTSFRSYWLPTETSSRRSPVNPMMPMPNTLFSRVEKLVKSMKGVSGYNLDIESLITFDDNSIVYIDPPYKNTTGYGYCFNIDSYIHSVLSSAKLHNKKVKVYISEGYKMAENAIQITGNRSKGGISGERKSKNEEWLNIYEGI